MFQVDQSSEESFYSVYSQGSAFDIASVRPQQIKSNYNHQVTQIHEMKMMKIAQSNIQLDEGFIDNASVQKKSYETLSPFATIQIDHQARVSNERNFDSHDISGIQMRENENVGGNQSMCLLKEIDCLSIQPPNASQLSQIKKKIELLKNEQQILQNSLSLANQMLKSTKNRNAILELQMSNYRKVEQSQKPLSSPVKFKQNYLDREHRSFPQIQVSNSNQFLSKLKTVYRECSLNESFCVYQNEGYKVEVFYEREKTVFDPKALTLKVKLTAHHHIVMKKRFKFGIEFQPQNNLNKTELNYQGAIKIQSFNSWPQGKFNISSTIVEIDQLDNKQQSHTILIPLPIVQFFQPRMLMHSQNQIKSLTKSMSQYSIELSGAILSNLVEKIKDRWWMNTFVSCLGNSQLSFVSLDFEKSEQKGEAQKIKIEVYGKKNGKVVVGIIEFLSFFLTS